MQMLRLAPQPVELDNEDQQELAKILARHSTSGLSILIFKKSSKFCVNSRMRKNLPSFGEKGLTKCLFNPGIKIVNSDIFQGG
jgi:hypothetical protein